jgi:hypothetical protein
VTISISDLPNLMYYIYTRALDRTFRTMSLYQAVHSLSLDVLDCECTSNPLAISIGVVSVLR